jgi:hypothetical protein
VAALTVIACAAETPLADESTNASELTTDGGDAGPHCRAPHLHSVDGSAGPYCPFQAHGAPSTCAAAQHCCDPGGSASVSTCSAACSFPPPATADAGAAASADWQCDSKTECPSGQLCCLLGQVAPTSTAGCSDLVGVNVRGTVCRASCAANEPVVCAQAADCSQGTCAPFSTRGKDLGSCR